MDRKMVDECVSIVVLEGESDWKFWSKIIDSRSVYLVAFESDDDYDKSNKHKVIESIFELRNPIMPWNESHDGILGLVDTDYKQPQIKGKGYNIDDHHIEIVKEFLLDNEKSIDDGLEIKIQDIRDRILTTSPNTDLDNVLFHLKDVIDLINLKSQDCWECSLEIAKKIGILRALNEEREYPLGFKKNRHIWIKNSFVDKSIEVSLLLQTVLDNTKPHHKKPEFEKLKSDYELATTTFEEMNLTSVQLANGHDIDYCMQYLHSGSIVPHGIFEKKIKQKVSFDSIRDTEIIKKIRDWEETNTPYRVLPH
jgi:hypothetical protein